MLPNLKFFYFYSLFKRLQCAAIISSIQICNGDIENWEFINTSRKYLNTARLLSRFKVGIGNSSASRGNMNYLSTAATLCITLVSYIGALLHVYWDVFAFWINTSRLSQSCPEIACILFMNRWYFSMLFPLLLPGTKGQSVIWRHLHVNSKAPLNRLYASTTTTATMPNYNTTSSINNLASDYALVYVVIENIINCVKPHIALSRWNPYWLLCSAVPSDHMSRFIIKNRMVTGQDILTRLTT